MMKTFITIDRGNTTTSVQIHNKDHVLSKTFTEYIKLYIDKYIETPHFIANVSTPLEIDPKNIFEVKNFFKQNMFLDMPVDYSETLGEDRLVAAYSVYKNLTQNERVLLIDSGTFLKLDLVTKKGFEGGFICPGKQSLKNSYLQGDKLPQGVNFEQKINYLPKETDSAISSGLNLLILSAVKELIINWDISKIVITGGLSSEDAALMRGHFKSIKVDEQRDLVHLGLSFLAKELEKRSLL